MKTILLLAFISFSFNTPQAFKKLHRITGVWKMKTSKGALYEEWKVLDKGKLKGKSYRVVGNDTTILENVVLPLINTSVFYVVTAAGENNNRAVRFKMISSAANTYVFENKKHDFPQRVIYRFVNNDSIVARIEGKINGKKKSSDFYYSRVK